MAGLHLTLAQARGIAVRAQLLDAQRPDHVVEVAEQLAAIKIDPTATIASCEQTILFSRIGDGYEPGQLRKAVEMDRQLFEYDAAFRPVSVLPQLKAVMTQWPKRESTKAWLEGNARFRADVLARLAAEGPLKAGDIPDTAQVRRAPDGWSGSNQSGIMLDFLSRQGVVAVVRREGRQRVWDLAERVWPAVPDVDPDEAALQLDERRLEAAGIAKQKSPWSRVGMAGVPATIEGVKGTWRIDPRHLDFLDEPIEPRVAFLNPYDPMLFDRPRLAELFDFHYVLEQFKPKHERRYGLFAHPVLVGDRFVALLEAETDRKEGMLRVRGVHELLPLDQATREAVADEIGVLASWLGTGLDAADEWDPRMGR